jgi:hypothetical protein
MLLMCAGARRGWIRIIGLTRDAVPLAGKMETPDAETWKPRSKEPGSGTRALFGNNEDKLQGGDGALGGSSRWDCSICNSSGAYTKARRTRLRGQPAKTRARRATNSKRSGGLVPVVHVSKASRWLPARSLLLVPARRNSEPRAHADVTCMASPRGRRLRSPGAAREQATSAHWEVQGKS